jgi:hypothetical protein
MPAPLATIAWQNKAVVYDIPFKAAAKTMRTIAADPKHLGAETGMIAVLHTWGQTLVHHPHVHCIVPGGGLTPDGRWLACRPGFFLSVRILSRLHRQLFLERLERAFAAGALNFFGDLAPLAAPAAFAACKTGLASSYRCPLSVPTARCRLHHLPQRPPRAEVRVAEAVPLQPSRKVGVPITAAHRGPIVRIQRP